MMEVMIIDYSFFLRSAWRSKNLVQFVRTVSEEGERFDDEKNALTHSREPQPTEYRADLSSDRDVWCGISSRV